MKKLFLLCILLFTVNTFAQEQSLRVYNFITVIQEGQEPQTVEAESRFFINYANIDGDVKLYIGSKTFLYRQIGETIEDKTTTGLPFEIYPMIELNTGEELYIQYFKNEDILRIIVNGDQPMIQFNN